jgi:glycosyltransferase involved in cell wall biosynthesis
MSINFSVIMPAYNVEPYIRDAIGSVLAQSYPNFELIIVNDGSTDNTALAISEFSDPRIKVVHQSNRGLGATRNVGISHSVNEYIAFLDSDDIWRADKLQNVVSNIGHDYSGVYYSNVIEFIGELSNGIPSRYTEPVPEREIKDLILIYDFIIVSSAVVPRVVIKEFGGFQEDLHGTEDWDLWIKIGQKYTFKKIPQYDCFYRINQNGLSKNRKEFLKKEYKVIKKHLIDGNLGTTEIKNMALWVWYKKNFYYSILSLSPLSASQYFLKMLWTNPLHPANFDFIMRAYRKSLKLLKSKLGYETA